MCFWVAPAFDVWHHVAWQTAAIYVPICFIAGHDGPWRTTGYTFWNAFIICGLSFIWEATDGEGWKYILLTLYYSCQYSATHSMARDHIDSNRIATVLCPESLPRMTPVVRGKGALQCLLDLLRCHPNSHYWSYTISTNGVSVSQNDTYTKLQKKSHFLQTDTAMRDLLKMLLNWFTFFSALFRSFESLLMTSPGTINGKIISFPNRFFHLCSKL